MRSRSAPAPRGRSAILLLALSLCASPRSARATSFTPTSEPTRTPATFPEQAFPIGPNSGAMVVRDFNGDGFKDVAVVNGGEYVSGGSLRNPDLSVLFGLGDGTFAPQIRLALGNAPVSVVTGDFNRDGTGDLAVGTVSAARVLIFLANRDQTFSGPVAYAGGCPGNESG